MKKKGVVFPAVFLLVFFDSLEFDLILPGSENHSRRL